MTYESSEETSVKTKAQDVDTQEKSGCSSMPHTSDIVKTTKIDSMSLSPGM